jgi:hypothetical protein
VCKNVVLSEPKKLGWWGINISQMLRSCAPQHDMRDAPEISHILLAGNYCFIANLLAVVKTDHNNGVGNKRAIIGSVMQHFQAPMHHIYVASPVRQN